jgi:hypothetical protein
MGDRLLKSRGSRILSRRVISRVGGLLTLVVPLASAGVLAQAPNAMAAVQQTLYVSPSGSGTTCSSASPCSLATAQSTVQGLTAAMTGDLVVQLAGGTYQLTSTLTFGASDSGQNGFQVDYEAASGQAPVFSGGAAVSGWTLHDSTKNIWQAPLPSGVADTRQLYVDGVRADLTRASASVVFGTMTAKAPSPSAPSTGGFTFTNQGPNSWSDVTDADVVYQPGNWWEAVCPVASISNGTLAEQDPCYSNAVHTGVGEMSASAVPAEVENDYALLSSPGEFAVSPSAGEVYYIPRPGETMSASTPAIVGNVQTLVDLAGTSASPVHNLSFTGIGFEYATGLFGSNGIFGTIGVVEKQANYLVSNVTTDGSGNVTTDTVPLAANVACHVCNNVTFQGDTFAHLGGSALGFDGGGSNDTVTGNIVTDVVGNGIQLGIAASFWNGSTGLAPPTVESGDTVTDNYVHDVAYEFDGGVGIVGTWVTGTTIAHNEVWDTPYTGISLGWGWGQQSTIYMAGNHVDYNYIHDVMTSEKRDGGSIYVNGSQSSSPGSTMIGNYVDQDSQVYAALYLDNGSSYWTVENNVVGGYAPSWGFVQDGAPTADHNTVENNYAGSAAGGMFHTPPADNTVANNTTGLTSWPTAAQSIIASAGLESAYVGLRGDPVANLDYLTSASASSVYSSPYPATNANNDAIGNPYASATTDTSPWWQTDLGGWFSLSDVQVMFRQDGYGVPAERQSLRIEVSNSSSVTSGYTVACVIGTTPLPASYRYDCPIPAGTWRYVTVAKTDGTELVLGQVRVFGDPNGITDLALGKTATESSTAYGGVASRAVDGNTDGVFNDNSVSHTNSELNAWWQVDLGASYNVSSISIYNRTDCCASRLSDYWVFVSNSPFNTSLTPAQQAAVSGVWSSHQTTQAGTPTTISVPAVTGRYVMVQLNDTDYLSLAEVQVYNGTPPS